MLFGLALASCTGNFEDYNTNHYQMSELPPASLLKPMIENIVNVQQNASQMQDQMVGTLGGYFTLSNRWGGQNFDTFNQSDGWNASLWSSAYTGIYGNFFKVAESTHSSGHYFAMARLVRAMVMFRVTDCYGPMPYSKIADGNFYVAYDSHEEVYKAIIDDCLNASNSLYNYAVNTGGDKPLGTNDPIYEGDYTKWARLANCIALRAAIRISTAFPDLAQETINKVYASPAGLITSNDDNAYMDCGTQTNPYFIASSIWGDLRVNASIVDYMYGYNDPRMGKYFHKSTFTGRTNDYIGMRSGTANFAKDDVKNYSMPNVDSKSKLLVYCAAETSFLQAEAKLRFGLGSESVKHYYENGILLSMDQYGVSGENYIADNTSVPSGHSNDPRGSKLNYTVNSKITIAWAENATMEEKIERIITQKWIANYPLGIEAWAEFRRTGYPELFPCIDNLSTCITDKARGMRRLRYPYTEGQTNNANYQAGVALLGGADNEATELVWGKK